MNIGGPVNKLLRTVGVECRRVRTLRQYQRRHHEVAHGVLKVLESGGGKCRNRDRRLCDEYAVEVLGSQDFAPWLYVYTTVAGKFKEGWIPDNYYALYVVPQVNGAYGALSDKKCISARLFRCFEMPDIGYLVNGRYLDAEHEIIEDEIAARVLFAGRNKIVFKADDSRRGRGVSVIGRENFDAQAIKLLGNGVFQEFVKQHSFYRSLSPEAVATMRVTTVIDQSGQTSVRSCYLRLGRSEDVVVRADNLIRVAIDTESGTMDTVGYLPNWYPILKHPDTGDRLGQGIPPAFNECCDLVKKLHSEYPFVQCIGWDLAVNESEEVKILEWNGDHNDIKFSECKHGPCFNDLGWSGLWRNKRSIDMSS